MGRTQRPKPRRSEGGEDRRVAEEKKPLGGQEETGEGSPLGPGATGEF